MGLLLSSLVSQIYMKPLSIVVERDHQIFLKRVPDELILFTTFRFKISDILLNQKW